MSRLLVALSAFCVVAGIAHAKAALNCDRGWTYIIATGKCHKLLTDAHDWASNRNLCQKQGGDLSSIPSAAANAALIRFAKVQNDNFFYSIGLHNNGKAWTWVDGTPFKYSNWAPTSPDPVFCAFAMPADGTWSTVGCTDNGLATLALCEKNAN